jgi:hypothetical protein
VRTELSECCKRTLAAAIGLGCKGLASTICTCEGKPQLKKGATTADELNERIKVLETFRSAAEERRRFAHTRRKLTLDNSEADQAREEERAARVELDRIQREISALEARLRSAVTKD